MRTAICKQRHQQGGVLHYENLIRDESNELRKLMKYLNIPVNEERLQCALKHDFATFKRNASVDTMWVIFL